MGRAKRARRTRRLAAQRQKAGLGRASQRKDRPRRPPVSDQPLWARPAKLRRGHAFSPGQEAKASIARGKKSEAAGFRPRRKTLAECPRPRGCAFPRRPGGAAKHTASQAAAAAPPASLALARGAPSRTRSGAPMILELAATSASSSTASSAERAARNFPGQSCWELPPTLRAASANWARANASPCSQPSLGEGSKKFASKKLVSKNLRKNTRDLKNLFSLTYYLKIKIKKLRIKKTL